MTNQNPEQLEAANAQVVYDKAQMLAFYFVEPQDVAAATAAILQAAFIIATADLSPERRAGMFMEYAFQLNVFSCSKIGEQPQVLENYTNLLLAECRKCVSR